MPLSKIQAESMNLADTYAFTGTVTGTPADVKLISTTTISGTPSTLEWKDSSLSGELDFSTYQYFTVNIHYFTHSSGSTSKNLYGRFIDANKTGKKKMMTWYFSNENHDVTSHLLATVGTGVWTGTSNALGGWQIYFDGSSFENGGVIKLYGHK